MQVAFKSAGIKRDIDVTSLIRAKYQDNLEFLQWIKCYFEYYCKGEIDYDANAKRKEAGINVSVKCGGRGSNTTNSMVTPSRNVSVTQRRSVSTPQVSSTTSKTVPRTVTSTMPKSTVTKSTTTTTTTTTTSTSTRPSSRSSTNPTLPSKSSSSTSVPRSSVSTRPSTSTVTSTSSNRSSVSSSLTKNKNYEEQLNQKDTKISILDNQIKELNQIIETLGKERDFYFNRLRNVEIYCQTQIDRNETVQDIEKILYNNEENETKVEETEIEEELDQF